MTDLKIRKAIRMQIINEISLYSEEKTKIENHFNKEIEDFRQRAIKIALANKYPYIKSYLEIALNLLETDIKDSKQRFMGHDELSF